MLALDLDHGLRHPLATVICIQCRRALTFQEVVNRCHAHLDETEGDPFELGGDCA